MASPSTAYTVRTLAFMGGYVALMGAAILGAFDDLSRPGAYAFALAAAAPVAGQIWATLVYMRDADEYLAALTARRFVVAAGLTLALWSGWGFGELFADLPHIEGSFVYPLFWALYGLVSPFLGARGAA